VASRERLTPNEAVTSPYALPIKGDAGRVPGFEGRGQFIPDPKTVLDDVMSAHDSKI
jgi:hypothetical protein